MITFFQHIPYTQLMSLNATLLNGQQCADKYGQIYGPDMVCVGYLGLQQQVTPCQQGVGAPLVKNYQLLALTAKQSVDCKTCSEPAAFVDVSHHANWILEKIGDGTNCNSSIWGTLGFLIFTIWTARRTKYFKFWL